MYVHGRTDKSGPENTFHFCFFLLLHSYMIRADQRYSEVLVCNMEVHLPANLQSTVVCDFGGVSPCLSYK